MKCDFSGYATKNDLKCSDGRIIRHNAFKESDGETVPLVWQHVHTDPTNVLGHAKLENRSDGVYAYCYLNNSEYGSQAKTLIKHGDINALSIYANRLVQNGNDVVHGKIREVSLVLSGANPGALIDNLSITHGDSSEQLDDEAIIYTGLELAHSEDEEEEPEKEESSMGDEKTVEDIINSMSDEQKQALYYIIGSIAEKYGLDTEEGEKAPDDEKDDEKEEMAQSEYGDVMSRNVFDNSHPENDVTELTHAEFTEIVNDAKRNGSLKESFLQHAEKYGIEGIDVLFPDAKTVTPTPDFISRQMDWVPKVLNGTHHTPFSRVKSVAADITADEARAKGYIKGKLKKEEVFKLLKRITTPTTIYKKQKLDRDDIVDITDLDTVAFVKGEMRMMLDEEIARAVLVGDNRSIDDPDKINEDNIRPIWTDDDLYSLKVRVDATATPDKIEDSILRARKDYRGTGVPTLFATPDVILDMLLQKDTQGRRIYKTEQELASALRVSEIIEVPILDGLERTDKATQKKHQLLGIIVNLNDYTIGADRGGDINLFDDFDIDYNQYKYLMETRISGALTHPKSAMIIEKAVASSNPGA